MRRDPSTAYGDQTVTHRRRLGAAGAMLSLTVASVLSAGVLTPEPASAKASGASAATIRALEKGKPSAKNTGVRPGSHLKRHNGNIVVRKAGTVLRNLDIHGFVDIKAANVKIINCKLRGGRATSNRGIVTNYGYRHLLVRDSSFVPEHPTVYQDGMKGWNYTLRRVHITGNVDSAKVQGDNVLIENSLLENTHWYAHDPNQNGGPTHNDGIQIQKGKHVTIRNNTIRNSSNFAVLGAAAVGNTVGLQIRHNWLDGGHCTVKLQELGGHSLSVTASGNRFGPHRKVGCPLVAVRGSKVTAAKNLMEQTGKAVKIYWTTS